MRNVLILGSGRSGTSMLAGTLAPAGYFLGGEPYPAREANPKGFFETAEVNGTNEVILAGSLPRHPRYQAGQRWLATLPLDAELASTPAVEERIGRLVARTPYLFKDPRFCLTLPVWRPHVADAVFLCVFRDPAETAESIVRECAEAEYLKGLNVDFARALEIWTAMYGHVLHKHAREGDWHFFHYEQLFTQAGLDRLERATGARVAREFPDPNLHRSRSDRAVSRAVRELYLELSGRASWSDRGPKRSVRPAPAAPRGAAPELSVILCTFNRRETLARSLASFGAQTTPPESFEIVVVDDGSTDGTAEMLDDWTFPVPAQVIHRENGGLAAARNSGIAAARGKFLLFVNDDTIAFPDLVAAHLAAQAEREDHMDAVLGTFEQPRAALDNALMRFLDRTDLVFRYAKMVSGDTYDYLYFWTCNISVPAVLVRTAGGFDESFRHYGCEDIELGWRLEQLGCRVIFDASARAHHEHVLDLDALERRTRLVAKAFVRLFVKHPECVEHPDWHWVRGHTVETIDAWVGARLSKAPALRTAAAELAQIDLGALEDSDAGVERLAEPTLAALGGVVRELSTLWWLDGFAAGLRDFGKRSFAELSARAQTMQSLQPRAPALAASDDPTPHALDKHALELLDQLCVIADRESEVDPVRGLERVRASAAQGEIDLATVDAIRLGAALASQPQQPAGPLVDLLNDLGVLRWRAGDVSGSLAVLGRALALVPNHELSRRNRTDIESSDLRGPKRWSESPDADAHPTSLNTWTREALDLALAEVGLAGKDVLEVGGAIPLEAARASGARRWSACYLGAEARAEPGYELVSADARRLPWLEASFDVVFSSCAFEHIQQLGVALAEMERVLRPGGVIVTLFAPIWSCAVGHHLWETDAQGRRIMFLDPVIPRFGHLLLTEPELAWYLEIVLGEAAGKRCTDYVFHNPCLNRLFEGDYQRLFERSGFDARRLARQAAWSPEHVPSGRLQAELVRLHPQGGDFATPGFRGVLVKPGARAGIGSARVLQPAPRSS